MYQVRFIAAIDDARGLAKGQKLPWKIPTDQKFFREQLKSATNLMGWNTFATNNFKPYVANQKTYVLSNREEHVDGVEVITDLQELMDNLEEDIWIVGGGHVFARLIGRATELLITRVKGDYGCDVVFPEFEDDFILVKNSDWQTENGYEFQFQTWVRK